MYDNVFMEGKKPNIRCMLAANLKKHRKMLGLSQEKLAEMADVSWQTVNSIECHRTWVSDKTLESLARALNVEIFELFIPPGTADGNTPEALLYKRLLKLRMAMKEDIDKRLDQFYLSEKSVLQ